MKKLVIFDLDGTLLDTLADLRAAVNHALAGCAYPARTLEEIRSFVGNGVGKLLERSLPEGQRSQEQLSLMREHFFRYYDAHDACLTAPYPGIVALLHRLQDMGVLLAVASNKYQQATERLVAHYFPEIHFARVCGQRDGFPIKPDPLVVADILASMHLSPADAIYVGDSDVDMLTANRAGVDAVGVSWGFRSEEELSGYHPLAIIDCAEDLEAIVSA